MHHIRNTLPDIKAKIQTQLTKYQAELTSLGGALGDANSGNIVLTIITEFCNEFRTVIDGNSNDLSVNELAGGARISFVFHELFSNGIKSLDPFDQVKDSDIRTILYNSSGSSPALFVGTTAFEVIIKQQIKRLEEPSLKCAALIYDELVRILTQLLAKNVRPAPLRRVLTLQPSFKRYPQLKERFFSVVIAFYKRAMVPTNKLVSDLVAFVSRRPARLILQGRGVLHQYRAPRLHLWPPRHVARQRQDVGEQAAAPGARPEERQAPARRDQQ